jgi:uncharacterized protein
VPMAATTPPTALVPVTPVFTNTDRATRPVELTVAVERHAGHLARAHALRGADAVHLASALAIGDPELIIAVWDLRLHAGARAAGCRVAAARLGEQP